MPGVFASTAGSIIEGSMVSDACAVDFNEGKRLQGGSRRTTSSKEGRRLRD
jgi:hypothetical protein